LLDVSNLYEVSLKSKEDVLVKEIPAGHRQRGAGDQTSDVIGQYGIQPRKPLDIVVSFASISILSLFHRKVKLENRVAIPAEY
jgi:hypothetical protein